MMASTLSGSAAPRTASDPTGVPPAAQRLSLLQCLVAWSEYSIPCLVGAAISGLNTKFSRLCRAWSGWLELGGRRGGGTR